MTASIVFYILPSRPNNKRPKFKFQFFSSYLQAPKTWDETQLHSCESSLCQDETQITQLILLFIIPSDNPSSNLFPKCTNCLKLQYVLKIAEQRMLLPWTPWTPFPYIPSSQTPLMTHFPFYTTRRTEKKSRNISQISFRISRRDTPTLRTRSVLFRFATYTADQTTAFRHYESSTDNNYISSSPWIYNTSSCVSPSLSSQNFETQVVRWQGLTIKSSNNLCSI